MRQTRTITIYSLVTIFCMVLSASCFKSLTTTTVVYENNFEDRNLRNITVAPGLISYFNGSLVMGKLSNQAFDLTVHGLPYHQVLRVEMDLYIHNNWNNELWRLTLDGQHYLITGFSNNPSGTQSYPNWLNGAMVPAGSNAQRTSLPGICTQSNSPRGSSMYHIIQTISHTANDFSLGCGDAGNSGDSCLRSWSIDNLKVSVFNN